MASYSAPHSEAKAEETADVEPRPASARGERVEERSAWEADPQTGQGHSPPGRTRTLLDRLTLAATSSQDLDEILERLASLAREAYPADRCSIFLFDESGSRLVPTTYVATPEVAAEIARMGAATRPHFRDMAPIDLDANPSRWRAFMRGRAIVIPDLSDSPLVPPEVVTRFRARSAVVVPLVAQEERLGVLALDWMAPKQEFSEPHLTLIEAIGAYASLVIRNARLFGKLDVKTRSLGRLVEVASALNSTLGLGEVLELARDGFAELLGSDHCSIKLVVEPRDPEDIAASSEASQEHLQRLTSEQASELKRLCADSLEPLACERLSRDGKIAFTLCPSSARSVAVFPLGQAEMPRGFVLAALSQANCLSDDQVEEGRALAGLATAAMERAELYESLRTQLQHMEVLFELSDAVAGTPDLSRAVRRLNDLMGRDIGIEVESIAVVNDRLRALLDADAPGDMEIEAIRSWRATLERSGSRPRPRAAEDAILVPIVFRGRLQGVLRLRPPARLLDSPSDDLLLALGAACAEVIHKAGLRRDLAESDRRLAIAAERERIAQDLHQSVGQLIAALGLQLANHAAQAPDEEWRERLEELADLTAKGSRQMREAIHSLLFFQVRRRGLVRSLRELAQTFEATTGVATSLNVRGRARALEPSKEDALFCVAHEAITNVQRHSGSSSVSMTLTYESGEIVLSVRDWGHGLGPMEPSPHKPGHFGLLGIRQRLEEAGGELLVANARPRGALIEARIRSKRRRSLAAHSDRRR